MIDSLLRTATRLENWRIAFGILLLIAAIAFFAVPAALLLNTSAWMVQTEGSPAGTILFVIVGSVGLLVAIPGVACAVAGATLLTLGTGWRGVLLFPACLAVVTLAAAEAGRRLPQWLTSEASEFPRMQVATACQSLSLVREHRTVRIAPNLTVLDESRAI
jgi:hypothetical protein